MGNNFICSRCGNSDPKYIGYLNGKPYCRFCISMRGKNATKKLPGRGAVVINLGYPLSKEQKNLSKQIVENYQNNTDT